MKENIAWLLEIRRGSHVTANPESRVSRIEWPQLLIAPSLLTWKKAWGEMGWG